MAYHKKRNKDKFPKVKRSQSLSPYKIKNPQGLKRLLRIAPWFASSSPSSSGRVFSDQHQFSVSAFDSALTLITVHCRSQAGLLALPTLASLPIRSRTVACYRQRCLLRVVGVRITAAGPLLNQTGFPLRPLGTCISISFQKKHLKSNANFLFPCGPLSVSADACVLNCFYPA